MKASALTRRAERRARNKTMVDLNLVSLIDIFTILIFFLLANASDVEILPNTKAVKLPESTAEHAPKPTVVIVVSQDDIVVEGRRVAGVEDALHNDAEIIAPLKTELEEHASRALIGKDAGVVKDVTIMGDKDIPYKLLKKVMLTCARAHYGNIAFAVLPKRTG